MAAIYERSDRRKLRPLQNSTQYMHFSKKKSNKRALCENVVRASKPNGVLECVRPFLHGKTKQANDIIITENNAVISDKREIAELFNAHFIKIADCVPLMKETDCAQHIENHPSVIAIHEKNKATETPLCFNFEHINQAQVERALLDVNIPKSCGHDMLSPRLLKESASVIAKHITNILNIHYAKLLPQCLENGKGHTFV